jgi:peptide/nickel transport system permease protein
MSSRARLLAGVILLGVLHLGVVCAGFFAPYDPAAQDREHPYAPPMRLHFVDANGRLHLRPFFYAQALRAGSFDEYEENRANAIPVKFFVPGTPYRALGMLPLRTHLFGSDVPLYLLGSDGYGRDLFSRVLFGGQVSLLAGLIGAALTLSIGLCIGALAGFWGGWKDETLMRVAELFLALPWIYLLFAMRAFLPLTVSPLKAFLLVVVVFAAVGWARPARMVRGIVLSAKERDFVRAARGFGASGAYLLRRHILPETAGALLTQAAILVPQFVLSEMTLSFL